MPKMRYIYAIVSCYSNYCSDECIFREEHWNEADGYTEQITFYTDNLYLVGCLLIVNPT